MTKTKGGAGGAVTGLGQYVTSGWGVEDWSGSQNSVAGEGAGAWCLATSR